MPEDQNNPTTREKTVEPVAPETTKDPKHEHTNEPPRGGLKIVSLGLFCFALSFLGAWAALASGVVSQNNSNLAQSRQAITQESEVISDVVSRVSPSVVSVVTESSGTVGSRSFTQQGAGTGVILSANGYIITNKHVVDGSSTVGVVQSDGTTYDNVRIVGTDPANDIAFLKVENPKNFKAARIGDSSKMSVGDKVIAIGNALGEYQTSVTSGIVSGLGRPLVAGDSQGQRERLTNLLQTDAAINPGNSGGPLVNLNGEIIGINTAIDQEAEGIGFAIPINDAKGLIKSVTETGKVSRAFLGVSHVMLTPEVAKEYELKTTSGAYIVNEDSEAVTAGSPAAKAGIKDGDIITKISGKELSMTNPLLSAVSQYVPGDKVAVTFIRESKTSTVEVILAEFPTN